MIYIENEYLQVGISNRGAQLSSLKNKATGAEMMWQADESVWPWHAPNLFPVVGGLINNQIIVEGETYTIPARHGFARTSDFVTVEAEINHAKFSLEYSPETLTMYPFKFDFQVIYDLIDNALRVTYKVINLDDKTVYFSVGGHPAFNVPFNKGENYEDYYLEFECEEPLETHMLSAAGFFTGETQTMITNGKNLPLTRELFAKDALVFKGLKSRQVTIRSTKHDQTLSVQFPHFPYLGIWAKPGADLVCIEPWLGYADVEGHPAELSHKEGIQKVEHGHVFEAAYYISI